MDRLKALRKEKGYTQVKMQMLTGIDQSDYSRQAYCETFSLPTGGLDLSANTNYDIWTTKTIPAPPSTNGTYTLKATVNNGTVTYSWV